MKSSKNVEKKRNKAMVEEAAERLAEILIKQVEWEKNKKKKTQEVVKTPKTRWG